MLRILVMGAGAIGGFVGGSLAAAGHQVTLVGRQPLMDTITANGLQLGWPGQPAKIARPQATSTVPETPFDYILLTVKAPATATAAGQLAPLLAQLPDTCVVSLQNGIGNEETLVDAFGPARVMAGTITIPIEVPAAGVIKVSKAKGGLGLAALSPEQPVQQLADALTGAGLPTQSYANWRAMKWSKLLLNIINNASSAILDMTPAEIIAQPALFNLEIAALQEGVAVMRAQNMAAVKLPGYPANLLATLVSAGWLPLAAKRAILRPFMLSGRGTKMPSLHIDVASGRPTSEIEALNGAIVRAGQAAGVPAPVNRALTETLAGIIAGRLNRNDFRHQPDKLLAEVAARRNE
ncbi:MAG: 2-dehydropantoate 2-reductase [Anaerolineae bacterium]